MDIVELSTCLVQIDYLLVTLGCLNVTTDFQYFMNVRTICIPTFCPFFRRYRKNDKPLNYFDVYKWVKEKFAFRNI